MKPSFISSQVVTRICGISVIWMNMRNAKWMKCPALSLDQTIVNFRAVRMNVLRWAANWMAWLCNGGNTCLYVAAVMYGLTRVFQGVCVTCLIRPVTQTDKGKNCVTWAYLWVSVHEFTMFEILPLLEVKQALFQREGTVLMAVQHLKESSHYI